MVETFEFDGAAIGAYSPITFPHRGEVCVEVNDGEPLALVYLTPEEARELAHELVIEAEAAEHAA